MSYYKSADVDGNDLVVQVRPMVTGKGIRMEALWSDYIDYTFRLPREGMEDREIGQFKLVNRTYIIFRTNDHDRYDEFVKRAMKFTPQQRELALALCDEWHGTAETFLDAVEELGQ